jgi:hypothetical protein
VAEYHNPTRIQLLFVSTVSGRWLGVWGLILACYLTAAGASNGHVEPNGTRAKLRIARVPSYGGGRLWRSGITRGIFLKKEVPGYGHIR